MLEEINAWKWLNRKADDDNVIQYRGRRVEVGAGVVVVKEEVWRRIRRSGWCGGGVVRAAWWWPPAGGGGRATASGHR